MEKVHKRVENVFDVSMGNKIIGITFEPAISKKDYKVHIPKLYILVLGLLNPSTQRIYAFT